MVWYYGELTDEERKQALKDMETVEILARLLYGEDSSIDGQTAIAYSIINRVIGDGDFKLGGEAYGITKKESGWKFLRNIIIGPAYNAIATPREDRRSYRVSEITAKSKDEKLSWENAKLLAILVYSLIGDHSSGELNRGETKQGTLHSPKSAEKYLSQFTNVNRGKLTNPIGNRESYSGKTPKERINPLPVGKHVFYNEPTPKPN